MFEKQAVGGVLHVPYTYFPDPCGGTEVYVRGLAQRLCALGYASAVAAPAAASSAYEDAGLPVHRFATDPRPRLDLAYGVPDDIAAENFRSIVAQTRPAIVHLHARTSAVSERLVDVAHAAGAGVVFTYHTPTASCARGTMMLFGKTPCDGRIAVRRCTACALCGLGVPRPLAYMAAVVPDVLYAPAAAGAGGSRTLSALRIPGLIGAGRRRFLSFMQKVDHVVAVSQWVSDVLQRNGVPAGKVMLSRQGIVLGERAQSMSARDQTGPLKIAYFGRIDRAKGPDLLARALTMVPDANVRIDMFAVRQSSPSRDEHWLAAQAQVDRRLTLHVPVAPEQVICEMAAYDMIAIPSRCLETGPLVALEAFAAGVPVLGANLGGIAELVRDGVDGMLVAPNDAAAWAAAIGHLAENRGVIERLRAGIVPPRAMDAAAAEMAKLYAGISARRSQWSASSLTGVNADLG